MKIRPKIAKISTLMRLRKVRYYFAAAVLIATGFLGYGWRPQKVEAIVPYTNSRVNVSSTGTEANGASVNAGDEVRTVDVSLNGRYVAFSSAASNLVANDTNNSKDVFVKDTITGAISRASVSSSGAEASNGTGDSVVITKDGRFVLFTSKKSSAALTGSNAVNPHLFRRDMQTGTTDMVSPAGGNIDIGGGFDLTSDGRYVVYTELSRASIPGATFSSGQVLVKDMQLDTYTTLSKTTAGVVPNEEARGVSVSCDGSKVAFISRAALTSNDTNGTNDLYIVNRIGGDTVSVALPGLMGVADPSIPAEISCDGSTVLFSSSATDMIPSESPGLPGLFAYKVATGAVTRVSVASDGTKLSSAGRSISISADGSIATFVGFDNGIVSSDTGNVYDVYLRNMTAGTTERISMRNSTTQTTGHSHNATISPEGTAVAYSSADTGIVASDTNAVADIFLANTGASACKL